MASLQLRMAFPGLALRFMGMPHMLLSCCHDELKPAFFLLAWPNPPTPKTTGELIQGMLPGVLSPPTPSLSVALRALYGLRAIPQASPAGPPFEANRSTSVAIALFSLPAFPISRLEAEGGWAREERHAGSHPLILDGLRAAYILRKARTYIRLCLSSRVPFLELSQQVP